MNVESITIILSLLGGVALFLFGMQQMSSGLNKVAGSKMEVILYKLTGNRIKGFLLGAGTTTVIHSSSATSVMVVSFVNSGVMKVRQGISVVMGAIFGNAVANWILVLSAIEGEGAGWVSLISTSTLTAIVAVIGIILRIFCRSQTKKQIGGILLGFSILMFGLSAMSGAVAPLRENEAFINFLTTFSNPVLGILAGCLFTCVIQSASAAIGILQTLAVTGLLTFSMAYPLLLGISIGAAIPVLISAIGTSVNGKRTAFVYLFIEVVGVLIYGPLFYIVNAFVHFPFMNSMMTAVSLAVLNTVTRFATVAIQLPFISLHERLLCRIFKDKEADKETAELAFLENRLLDHPGVAINQCRTALAAMAGKAHENVLRSWELINNYSEENYQTIQKKEATVDKFFIKLGDYLVKLAARDLSEEQGNEVSKYILIIGELERIGDRAVVFSRIAKKINNNRLTFPADATAELEVLQRAVDEIISISIAAFTQGDQQAAYRVGPLKELIGGLCSEIKMRQILRMQGQNCSINNITAFNDLLTNYERTTDLCQNIALGLIHSNTAVFDTDEYLSSVQDIKSFGAQRFYDEYKSKYALSNPVTETQKA
ncbi:MAG: Na/Pi cotransporter family protein [Eubacteriales bacterium]|jgi:phosphate:Na+ symporter